MKTSGLPKKLDAHLNRLSVKYGLNQNEPVRDLKSRIKKGEIDSDDINVASAIVAEVSNVSATDTSQQKASSKMKQIMDSMTWALFLVQGLPFIFPIIILVKNISRNGIFQIIHLVFIVAIIFQACIVFSLGPLQGMPDVPNLIISHPIEFFLTYVFLFPICLALPTFFLSRKGEYVPDGLGIFTFIGVVISGIALLLMLAYAFLAGGNLTAFTTLLLQFAAISALNILVFEVKKRNQTIEP